MATSIPPHNAAELCDAALHLIENRKATTAELLAFVHGPDFPTGGVVVEPKEAILQAYETGRGGFRLRARWEKEEGGRGTWVAVVTEIPYGVPKGRLIERAAELLESKKLPLVADLRDESAEDVRIVIEPRNRSVDPAVMMESLFRVTDLESRIPLNMNVLMGGQIPRVVSLAEVLLAWLDHRREVLLRRSRHRLAAIERRLEILAGLLIVYLNLDEVIRIIRQEDDAKLELMRVFTLTEIQANAILDTRLRALRRARGDGTQARIRRDDRGEGADRAPARLAGASMESARRRHPRGSQGLRPGHEDRQAAHDLRRGAAHRRCRSRRGQHGARAGDLRAFGEGMGARAQGPCAGSLEPAVQRR